MDLMSLIGWLAGALVLFVSITFNKNTGELVMANLANFWDIPSILVVIGGTTTGLMVSFPAGMFLKIPKHLKIVLFPAKYNPREYIEQIVALSVEARTNGLLSLEQRVEGMRDPFLKSSMMLVIDAIDSEKVRYLLNTELEYLDERHSQDRAFYDRGAAYAPAFGMLGTLIALCNLLGKLDDASAIAPAMALALITTFYGSIMANLFFLPISNKLMVRHNEEYLCKMIVVEGVLAIQAGDTPKFVEEKLNQLIPGFMIKRGMAGARKFEK